MTDKQRLHVYISTKIFRELLARSAPRGASRSAVVEHALQLYFEGELRARHESPLIRRMDKLQSQLVEQSRSVDLTAEILAAFARMYLMFTPPLPPEQQQEARALGNQRFEFFRDELHRDLASGGSLLGDFLRAKESGFFTEEEMSALRASRVPDPSRSSDAPPSADPNGDIPDFPEEMSNGEFDPR